eukprot:SAG11_NODE_8519_length_1006_cov_16.061742_1_plen_44_part_10
MTVLFSYAVSLRGRNFTSMFMINTGDGGEGKGTMWALVESIFGT